MEKPMPIYKYKCKKCDKVTEKIQSFEAPPPKCKNCNIDLEKLIANKGGFILKGNGWFKTGGY